MRGMYILAALAVTGLAGCDDATGLTQNEQDYNATAMAFNDMADRIDTLDVSTAATMPTVGGATYNGYSTIFVDTFDQTALAGEATINADFSRGELSGNLTNFLGSVDGGETEAFNGSIGLRNGEIGATTANSLTAEIKGAVSVPGGDSVAVNGDMRGVFYDDGVRNADSLTALSTSGTGFQVNGINHTGSVQIVAER